MNYKIINTREFDTDKQDMFLKVSLVYFVGYGFSVVFRYVAKKQLQYMRVEEQSKEHYAEIPLLKCKRLGNKLYHQATTLYFEERQKLLNEYLEKHNINIVGIGKYCL